MGHTMTTARPTRRARLKIMVTEPAESETIKRVLWNRLRLRRERRIAKQRREAEHQKQAPWVNPREIAGEANPHDLETVLRSGRVRARFYAAGRWWQWKEATPREAIRIGLDGGSLVDSEHWVLRINEQDWCEYLSKPDASSSSAEVPPPVIEKVPLRDATDDEVRIAMRAVYDEAGEERPDTKKIVPLVRDRLETNGLYASWEKVGQIAREREFHDRRDRPGPTRKTKKRRTK